MRAVRPDSGARVGRALGWAPTGPARARGVPASPAPAPRRAPTPPNPPCDWPRRPIGNIELSYFVSTANEIRSPQNLLIPPHPQFPLLLRGPEPVADRDVDAEHRPIVAGVRPDPLRVPGRAGGRPADPSYPAPRPGRGDHRRPIRQVPHPLLHPGVGRCAGVDPGRARPHRTPAAVGVVRDRPAAGAHQCGGQPDPPDLRRGDGRARPAGQRGDAQLGDGQRGPRRGARGRREC